ncbi:MAG: TIR domain-containing protein [Schaedlerella sp.]|nr:TIR domain-containing protein [Schaedlerella sp.]
MSYKKNVFISYKSEEFDKANWVKMTLEHNGISCWMAPGSIQGGASYAMEIPKAIRACKIFVLILSEKAQDSKWVPRELDQAINEGKMVMPFMLEDCLLKDDFNFYLTNVQRYEAYRNKSAAMERMINEIKAALAKQTSEKEEILDEVVKENTEEVLAEKKKKKSGKKKISKIKLIGGIAAAIAVVVIGGIVLKKTNQMTIAGNIVEKDQGYLILSDVDLSPEDIENIKKIDNLYSVELRNCTFPEELFAVINRPEMIEICLDNCNLTNEQIALLDFKKMEELNILEVDNNPELSDLSCVQDAMDTIYNLSLDNTSVTDLQFIKNAEYLYNLSAEHTQTEDISVLGTCVNLEEICLDGNQISSLEPLVNCKNLREISVNDNALKTLKGLENCLYLTNVYAGYNQLTSLEGLENATLLTRAFLNNNQLKDISVLQKSVQNLTGVYVNNNQLTDLLALRGCTVLEFLSADNNQIRTLEDLADCTTIEWVSVENNALKSLDGLTNCKELQYIDASDNQLVNTEALADLRVDSDSGAKVDVSNNQLTEYVMGSGNYYWYLDLSGNPLQNFDTLYESTGYRIAFDYAETIQLENLKECFDNLWIMKCPPDQQVAVESVFGGLSVTFDNLSEMESAKRAGIPDSLKGDLEYYDVEK